MSSTTQTDLIERLPYEAWLRCLYFASDSENGPLPFLFLSRRWSQTILEEPSLWTTIVLSGSGEDELARLHTFLHLSRGHSLDIILDSPEHDYAMDSMEMVVSQAQRIRSITKTHPAYRVNRANELAVIGCFTTRVSCYPQLRRMDVNEGHPEWSKIIKLCPILWLLGTVPIPLSTALPSTIQDIATITPTSLDEALILLQKGGLRHLGINYGSVDSRFDDRAWTEHAYRLSQGNFGRITRIEIYLNLTRLQIMASIISVLPQLRSLTLNIINDRSIRQSWTPSPLFPDSITHIRYFSMTWLQIIGEKLAIKDAFIPMFSTTKALGQVHSFNFFTDLVVPMEVIHKLLISIPRVRTLRFRLGGRIDRRTFPSVILDNVLELYLAPALISTYIKAPNAIAVSLQGRPAGPVRSSQFRTPNQFLNKLVISSEYLDEINSTFPKESIKTQWPALHNIELQGNRWCRTLVSMESLREVYFINEGLLGLNGFLLDLVRNSHACPNLRVIKSESYSQWELLFEVMRRRNRNKIPIKQLSIPGYPAPAILRRLVLLLQGQADVYTERDIDEVIYKRFGSGRTNFRACETCARLGYTGCFSPIESAMVSDEHFSPEPIDLLQLCSDNIAPPTESRDTKKWGNITKEEGWYKVHPILHLYYSGTCRRRFRLHYLVDITGSTLDGVCVPGMMGHAE